MKAIPARCDAPSFLSARDWNCRAKVQAFVHEDKVVLAQQQENDRPISSFLSCFAHAFEGQEEPRLMLLLSFLPLRSVSGDPGSRGVPRTSTSKGNHASCSSGTTRESGESADFRVSQGTCECLLDDLIRHFYGVRLLRRRKHAPGTKRSREPLRSIVTEEELWRLKAD